MSWQPPRAPSRPLTAVEESLRRFVANHLALCVPAPPSEPSWTAVNPIPAKPRAAAGISRAMELKAGRGMSPAQRETHHAITVAGGVVTTCRSLDDVAAFLVTLGVPSRTTAP